MDKDEDKKGRTNASRSISQPLRHVGLFQNEGEGPFVYSIGYPKFSVNVQSKGGGGKNNWTTQMETKTVARTPQQMWLVFL